MKNNLRFITAVVLSIFFHSCGGQGDPFVGNWIVCNRPEYTCVISKKENTYNLHSNNGIPDLVLEKKGEDVLLAIAGDLRGTVRYDKITNHLFLIEVINKEEKRIELCRSSDNNKQENLPKSRHNNSQENDHDAAHWDSVIKSQPSSRAYSARASLFRKDRKYAEAIDYYTKAIQLNAIDHESYNNRANIYMDMNKFDSALPDYKQALVIMPNYYVAFDNLGALYARRNMFDSALYYFNRALEQKPDYKVTYSNRALTYMALRKYDEAIKDWQTALEYEPGAPDIINTIGLCYRMKGQYQVALKYISQAIQISPEGPFFLNRSYTYTGLNNIENARKDAQTAKQKGVQVDPTYAATLGIQ